jgi:hypothetical protein
MLQRRLVGIVSCILFLWPCLSVTLTGEAIKDAEEIAIWAESPNEDLRNSIQVSFSKDGSGKEFILAELIDPDSSVRGLKDIQMFTDGSSEPPIPPMLGKSVGEGSRWKFYPSFPLQQGLTYLVTVLVGDPSEAHIFYLTIPEPIRFPEATVAAVYPSKSELPENLLKFYIHFSHPMSIGNVYDHIHLLDEKGEALDLPFLELGEELWDYDTQRLTLLFDPGRIKTGLVPNLEEGMVLEEGKDYTLKIDEDWLDAEGRPLIKGFQKTFAVVEADRVSPNPYNWKKKWPKENTRNPLTIEFPESLDEALLQRVVEVRDEQGMAIEGTVKVSEYETRWEFIPQNNWGSGKHRVEIETILEDVAGNSIARPFELDKKRSEIYREGPKVVYLDFVIQ